MIKTLAGALNGALLLATMAAFSALYASSAHLTAVVVVLPSLLLALAAAFIAIGGLDAMADGDARNVRLCAGLSLFWTAVQAGFAFLLLSLLLPEGWLGTETAHAWMLTATAGQAVLLAVVARAKARVRGRRLEL